MSQPQFSLIGPNSVSMLAAQGNSSGNFNLVQHHSYLTWSQRQARELIFGPSQGAKTRLLSFNRTQSRVVIDLLTGHNTLRRHLHLMGLTNSPWIRRCGVEDETSAHIFCECEAFASLRHVYLGSFFLNPENIKSLSLGAILNFSNGTGLPELISDYGAQKAH